MPIPEKVKIQDSGHSYYLISLLIESIRDWLGL
jgi:hypothetical protein